MSLVASFKHPVADAQFSFRRILKALSEPGSIVALPEMSGFGVLDSASACVLLTLIDQDTPLWISPRLNDDVLRQNLRFHTGAVLTEDPSSVSFALAEGSLDSATLLAFPCGDEMSPELATSVIVQVESLEGGKPLRLLGPGIEQSRVISVQLPDAVTQYLLNRPHRFPLGLDFMFTCGEQLLALPRTTRVEAC
ncbi:phosphonate C-P lyase system protein PhnH [Rouxiella badensis]|jgi:alpha-D-ribose 1-methylphosphonate 5-triphosphate synthase subunit PhnH|uniref:Phosphonate C-P lyase system protein PhnH n=1 Tax=Rouxiella badensis TaxID=1646377 RepID=A0A1X0WBF1_9GAMM|nr:phosphonate C-P lyase system protein PhnH [Rouxiella badensis]MCC3704936.1 phosphonate C-P lyase system protein PhnH [Rouxiella badensis]MCC3733269.1 phosphonate C-P lyase system protein PhnH [Rouxiella badensis]MCC3748079.1 phosphonate C-P lyase system protein PhnH [Rouxiella badensis]MCC3758080.1 phosphonate C-P lyase system protein PhnH [Rouxiella badensis]ORJ24110.1 phosphonate C-P lyase system protein PhnH [Rouxiella badensis]